MSGLKDIQQKLAMKNILVTGFEPFDDIDVNPSWLIAKRLNGQELLGTHIVASKLLPVTVDGLMKKMKAYIEEFNPSMIVCLGVDASSPSLSSELLGANYLDFSIPDNDGNIYKACPIDEAGPDAIFSTLPVHDMVNAMSDFGAESTLSMSAGSYVCNFLLYSVLKYLRDVKSECLAGFIHVPLIENTPEDIKNLSAGVRAGLIAAIKSVA